MKKLLLAALLALSPATGPALAEPATTAEARTEADPALWVVRDEDTTIYLFGTFHLLDGRPWFNDQVRTAFEASDELVMEAIIPENPAEMAPLVMRYAVDPQGRTLSQRLTAEQNAALATALDRLGLPAAAFDLFEPWFAAMTLATAATERLGVSPEHGAERVLSQAARERAMPVAELEGVEWQIRLLDALPDEQQMAQLTQAIEEVETLGRDLTPMLAAWSAGDVDTLVRYLNDYRERDPALHQLIFTDRNTRWAEWIADRMDRPGTVFVAVGAGHLAGDDSVQAALRQQGLSAQRTH